MVTVAELLRKAEQSINCSAGSRLDAEILLCHVMQTSRPKIYSHPEKTVSDDKTMLFQSLLKQRLQGRPIAHLTGEKEFWSLELAINEDTLIPRPETELLVETALQKIPVDEELNILDLGTGSGAVAIAIASERPRCHLIGTDINKNALTTAKQNAATHCLKNIQFYHSDWYRNIPPQNLDLIVSNPPYIKQGDKHLTQGDVRFESRLALVAGSDGMQAINIIIEHAGAWLADAASLFIEHGRDQKTRVQETFRKHRFKQIKTFQDIAGHDRVTSGRTGK